MIWKNALKYPVLIIGIIMFIIFLNDPKTKDWYNKISRRYIPSTCDAIISSSAKKADKSWKFECPGTKKLVITIPYEEKDEDNLKVTRVKMYRLTANAISSLAQITDPESMQHILVLQVIIDSERLDIVAQTDGEAIVQIRKTINEYDDKALILKAQKLAMDSGESDGEKLNVLTEKFAKELRDKAIENNLKKVPELLKLMVKTREITN